MNKTSLQSLRLSACLIAVAFCLPKHASSTEPEHAIFFGGDLGVSYLVTSSPTSAIKKESDKSGTQFNLKLLYSHYWESWLLDGGFGWMHSNLGGNDLVIGKGRVQVKTNALFVELSPRYRFNPHWQLGPVLNFLIGSDVSFSETTGGSGFTPLAGLRVQYENTLGNRWIWRAGLQGMTDLLIANRQLYAGQLDLQIGMTLGGEASRSEEAQSEPEPTPRPRSTPRPTPSPTFFPEPVVSTPPEPQVEAIGPDQIKIRLPESLLRFDTGRSSLSLQASTVVQEIGKYLSENGQAWSKIRVEGHSDRRGDRERNLELSLARAQAVRDELLGSGIAIKKIEVAGIGPDKPAVTGNSPSALAANRRVEIYLHGVKKQERLASELRQITEKAMH